MTATYNLNCDAGHFALELQPAGGVLSAPDTGRSIEASAKYAVAKDWLNTYEISQEQRSDLEQEFLKSLGAAEEFDEPVFRGRCLCKPPDSWRKFGPPSQEKAKRGRYNAAGTPALYLSSSKNGVKKELGSSKEGKQHWIQQFRISPELRIADGRKVAQDSLAAVVFLLIERGRELGAPPLLGQRIGQIVMGEFDGLIVPGVRGNANEPYWNVVVFRPHDSDRWCQLVDKNAPPEEVSH